MGGRAKTIEHPADLTAGRQFFSFLTHPNPTPLEMSISSHTEDKHDKRGRPFVPFFHPFPEGLKSTWEIQKMEGKGLFPHMVCLNPHLLNPHLRHPKNWPIGTIFVFSCPGVGDFVFLGPRLRGRTWGDKRQSAVFCGFLRFSAVSCENQRFSAKICVSQMLCFLGKGGNLQKSAKISGLSP